MIIRQAIESDLNELSHFATQAFYDAYDWYNTAENMRDYVKKYFSKENLLSEFNQTDTVFLVALDDHQKIIGYAKIGKGNNNSDLNESHSEIERIYVDTKLQRAGIGQKLIDEIIHITQQRNQKIIWLGVWQKNEKAVNFYKKIGFEIFGTTTFVLGNDPQDDYMMKLVL
jgi:ribosomal protein S18 acetylase RimI-like enzyme